MDATGYGILRNFLIAMCFTGAAEAADLPGEKLDHRCLDPKDNLQRIVFADACQGLAVQSGYRIGVFRPCSGHDVSCAQSTDCAKPEISHVCIGYSPTKGDCAENSDCKSGYYCKKEPGVCIGRGFCELIPVDGGCQAIYDPVCGCDDNTYNNSCEATSAGVNIQSTGACM